jgi:hypothetical protein
MDRTNLFFLVVAGGAAWFLWREYQKQKDAQQRMFAQQRLQNDPNVSGRVVDYAERVSAERDWARQASIYGG